MHFSGNNTYWFVWVFSKPLSLYSMWKSKMLLYLNQKVFGPGKRFHDDDGHSSE